jgi:isopenicillin N synthase-like dioxygenase
MAGHGDAARSAAIFLRRCTTAIMSAVTQQSKTNFIPIRQNRSLTGTFYEIPVLNLPDRSTGNSVDEEDHAFARQLRSVCHNVGFFYIANHGVKDETFTKALESTKLFFDQDLDQKMQIDYRNSPAFRGYIQCNAENTAGRPDHREQVEVGVEAATSGASPNNKAKVKPFYKRLMGPNQWPDSVPHLRPHISQFLSEMEILSRRLMQYLALSLDLKMEYFDDTFGDCPNVQLKLCRYPPVLSSESEDGFGVGAHTDSGYLSLLIQDEVGGLQVQNDNGYWISAPPIAGTIVVNLGEMLQLCTNGYFLATPHRVVSASGTQARYSLPYFWNPRLDFHVTNIDPFPSTLQWERHGPTDINAIAFTASHGMGGNRLLNIYGENAFKSLVRSHPEVMKKHHSDLLVHTDGSITEISTVSLP